MIDRLVNHARAGQTSKSGVDTAVLPDVIDRCRGLLSRVAGRTVEVSYGVGAFQPVRVAVESVERILTNLVKNAAEATPWVGAISIHVEGVTEWSGRDGFGNEDDQSRNDYYVCNYSLSSLKDRSVLWTKSYEVQKKAVKAFLD